MAKTAKNKKNKMDGGEGFTIGESGAFSLSLGALLGKNPQAQEAQEAPEAQKTQKTPADKKTDGLKLTKVSLQHQKSGCGGKTVTVVTLPKECAIDKEQLAKELRCGLGCGSRVEEGKIILQGDICDRAAEWFSKKGVVKIIRG